jgi:beta-glucanase (GH16 family)/uncharacterized protein (DUF2141 family)
MQSSLGSLVRRMRRTALVLFSVLVLLTVSAEPASAAATYRVEATQSGTSLTVKYVNMNRYNGSYRFEIQLWNSSGQQVAQTVDTRRATNTRTVSITKTIPDLPAGTYTVRGGFFGANGTPKYTWSNNAGTVNVAGPVSTSPTYTVSATTSSSTFATTFASSQDLSGSYLFDVEIWNSSNQRVFQQYETRAVSGTKSVVITKNIPTLPNGTYSVRAGLFSPDWVTKYVWSDSAGSLVRGSTTTSTTSTTTTSSTSTTSTSTTSTTAPPPPPVSATYSATAAATAGGFDTKFQSSQNFSGTYLFDVEIWNSSNQRVFQQYETRAVSGTKTVTISKSWPALGSGTYTIRGGIFGPNWTPSYLWSDSIASVTLPVSNPTTPPPNVPQPNGPTGTWNYAYGDEFNASFLDSTKWLTCSPQMAYRDGMCFGHSGEQQVYKPQNVSIVDYDAANRGVRISATNPNKTWGNTRPQNVQYGAAQYESGALSTGANVFGTGAPGYQPFSYKYGYVEARVRVPKGQGYFPAIWTFSTDHTGPWEIDVCEFLGENVNRALVAAHYPAGQTNAWIPTGDLSAGFHTFGIDWQPDYYAWYIDGNLVRKVDTTQAQISAKSHYLILNLAVGGNWPGPPDATTPFPANFDVDWIRIWQK